MAAEGRTRFTFDFTELRPQARASPLRVLEPAVEPPPAGATKIAALPRPRWLGRLLPVFRTDEPLRVIIGAAAGSSRFAALLQDCLIHVIAAAGAEAGLQVLTWPGGFAVGTRLDVVPTRPHAWVVTAELFADSVASVAEFVRTAPAADVWLILNGDLPQLDPGVGLTRELAGRLRPDHLRRMPLVSGAEMRSRVAGASDPLALRFARSCQQLASQIAVAYAEADR